MIVAPKIQLVSGDITPEFAWSAHDSGVVAWDIETSGLDWSADEIATCQIHVPELGTQIVQVQGQVPRRLRELLSADGVTKVFHHAAFDLRFMRHHWGVVSQNVACTKILSKIVRPDVDARAHSLQPTLRELLHVEVDKTQQASDWRAPRLDAEQIEYAARDVEFLIPLRAHLMDLARLNGLADLVERTFAYLPTRIETDLRGCGDVFAY